MGHSEDHVANRMTQILDILIRRTLNGVLVEACQMTQTMRLCLLVITLISSLTGVTAQSWPKHYNPFFEGGVGCTAINLGSKSVSEYKVLANMSGYGLLVCVVFAVSSQSFITTNLTLKYT
jgi:hypothetical protein